jgi:hypothetical protein
VTPIEEWEARHTAVAEMVRIAEEATPGPWEHDGIYVVNRERRLSTATTLVKWDGRFIAAHDPSWALSVHREALERLNRHLPATIGCCLNCCDSATHRETGESTALWPCPEVAGLRSVYMKGEQT